MLIVLLMVNGFPPGKYSPQPFRPLMFMPLMIAHQNQYQHGQWANGQCRKQCVPISGVLVLLRYHLP